MRMAFSRGRESAIYVPLGVAFVGAALVSGKCAALTIREFGFCQLSHAAVPRSIKRERCRQPGLIPQPAN